MECNLLCIWEERSADVSCGWFTALYCKSVWKLIEKFAMKMQEMQFPERDSNVWTVWVRE